MSDDDMLSVSKNVHYVYSRVVYYCGMESCMKSK